ncbi:MAG: four helix bundle protein [Candidatus Omnitrophota bacterium]
MGGEIKGFEDLIVWQKADRLFYDLIDDVKNFPKTQITHLIIEQIVDAVSSISANIAEATGTNSGKEFEHFLIIARRSTVESKNWYIKIRTLKYISEERFKQRYSQCEEIRVMLNALIGSSRRRRKLG